MLLKKEVTEEVLDWIKSFVIMIAGFWLFFTFIAAPFMVNGSSMRPTLQNKEHLLVNKFIYHFQEPQKGDIIVFEYPSDRSRNFVKRVIATSGDTIEITDSMVFVNGKLITSNGHEPKEGDIISVRGKGRFIYDGIARQTKKGRNSITIHKYI